VLAVSVFPVVWISKAGETLPLAAALPPSWHAGKNGNNGGLARPEFAAPELRRTRDGGTFSSRPESDSESRRARLRRFEAPCARPPVRQHESFDNANGRRRPSSPWSAGANACGTMVGGDAARSVRHVATVSFVALYCDPVPFFNMRLTPSACGAPHAARRKGIRRGREKRAPKANPLRRACFHRLRTLSRANRAPRKRPRQFAARAPAPRVCLRKKAPHGPSRVGLRRPLRRSCGRGADEASLAAGARTATDAAAPIDLAGATLFCQLSCQRTNGRGRRLLQFDARREPESLRAPVGMRVPAVEAAIRMGRGLPGQRLRLSVCTYIIYK
jgi:hypothetical protein